MVGVGKESDNRAFVMLHWWGWVFDGDEVEILLLSMVLTKRDKAKKGELLSSKANQAEAHVDVVGLAAAATNKGQKADVEGESWWWAMGDDDEEDLKIGMEGGKPKEAWWNL